MVEIENIINKYKSAYITEALSSLESLKKFAGTFYRDVAEIYDCLTRLKNIERNPSGFTLDDAPILFLLVRVAKRLKEVIVYYEKDNAEIISILERPLIEASIGVYWDADMRFESDKWELYNFKGTKWQNINDAYRRVYLANAYRVLLTRARQGMVIFAPQGDERDLTRPPQFYDPIYAFLQQCGIRSIH